MATTISYDSKQNLNLGFLPVHVCGPLSKLNDRYVHTYVYLQVLLTNCSFYLYNFLDGKTVHSNSGFSRTHKIVIIGIIANFVFPYFCSFLLYLHHIILVNVTLNISGYYISRLQTLLVLLISNGTVETKFAILAFLYSGEFVKNTTYPEIISFSTLIACNAMN